MASLNKNSNGDGWTVVRRRVRHLPQPGVGGLRDPAPPKKRKKWVVKFDHNPRPLPCMALKPVSPARSYICVLMSNVEGAKKKWAPKPPAAKDQPKVVSEPAPEKGLRPNPAYVDSYRNCGDLEKTLNGRAPAVCPETYRLMKRMLDDHEDQRDVCCTVRSLLAFCGTDEEFKFVAEQNWNGMSADECVSMSIRFAKLRDRPLDVRRLNGDAEFIPLAASKGKGKLPVTVCIAHTFVPDDEDDLGAYIAHAMPLFAPHWHAVCKAKCNHSECRAVRIVSRCCGKFEAAAQKMAKKVLQDGSSSSNLPVVVVKPVTAPKADKQVAQVQTVPVAPVTLADVERSVKDLLYDDAVKLEMILRKSFGLPAVCDQHPSVVKAVRPTPGVSVETQTHVPTHWHNEYRPLAQHQLVARRDAPQPITKRGNIATQVISESPCSPPGRWTVEYPPQWLQASLVRRGARPNCFRQFVDVTSGGPNALVLNTACDLVPPSATVMSLVCVSRWGDMCRYVPADRYGHANVGGIPDLCLGPDAILEMDGYRYGFVRDDIHFCCSSLTAYRLVLKSAPQSIAKMFMLPFITRLPYINRGLFTVVESGIAAMDAACRREAKWSMERQTEKDAINASLIAKAQARALQDKEDNTDPEAYSAAVRLLRRQYERLDNVGGTFAWGYCYGCGTRTSGRMAGRVCAKCQKQNSTRLARMVAEGEDVCTTAAPVRYPGLVLKPASHPALKDGVETRAVWGKDVTCAVGYGKKKVKLCSLERALSLGVVEAKGPTLAGTGFSGLTPFVTAAGVRALIEAIMYRVFKKLPDDRVVNAAAFTALARNAYCPQLLAEWLQDAPEPMSVEEWIESMPAIRRRALRRALKAREERGVEHPDFDLITPFVKKELLPDFKPLDFNGTCFTKPKYVARLIQAPNDETHLIAGPWMKPLVRTLKRAWHENNWIFYGSVAPDKLNKWLARIAGCESFFWSDYSSFDATFSSETWAMLEGFYHHIYPNAPLEFRRVLDIWRTPKGKALVRKQNATVRYQAQVCNCSGRDDTALANALFNGLALSTSFAAALAGKNVEDVTPADLEHASSLCMISVVGDDSLVGCHFDVARYAEAIVAGLKQFGLVVKAEFSYELHDVTFLGMMPYRVAARTYEWGPTIGRRLYKMLWMREYRSPAPWVRGVAQAMCKFANVPILSDLARKVDELLHGHNVTPVTSDQDRPWTCTPTSSTPWSETTLDWLCARYRGLTKAMIRQDLATISRVTRLPCVLRLESLRVMCAQDDL